MYKVADYGRMIADSIRTSAYLEALRQSIKPGAVVLDIGTGIGFFAMLACQYGARRVYAVEPDDAIEVARKIAAANGLGDRIEFIQDLSTRINLPDKADVIISDLRGVLPFFQRHIPSIIDARQRLLAPAGILIPQCDVLWAAIVEAPDLYDLHMVNGQANDYGLDMQAARQIVTNTWRKARVTLEQLLTEPRRWATLDYSTLESHDISAELDWTAMRSGVMHGMIAWFDTTLAEGVSFSNAPGETELIYGNAFFPLPTAVTVAAGDSISVRLQADLIGEDYIWRWNTQVLEGGDASRAKAEFKQSTFFGKPLSSTGLQKRAASHIPELNEDGQIDQFILSLMNGKTSLEEIARRALCSFPEHFATWQDALTRIGELSLKYSK